MNYVTKTCSELLSSESPKLRKAQREEISSLGRILKLKNVDKLVITKEKEMNMIRMVMITVVDVLLMSVPLMLMKTWQ